MKPVQLAIIILLCISTLVLIISLATNDWLVSKNGAVSMGLWKFCYGGSCADIPVSPNWYKTVRALYILGGIANVVAILTAVVRCVYSEAKQVLYMALILTSLVAGILSAAGLIVFVSETQPKMILIYDYGWSFGIGWVSVIMDVVASFLTFALTRGD